MFQHINACIVTVQGGSYHKVHKEKTKDPKV